MLVNEALRTVSVCCVCRSPVISPHSCVSICVRVSATFVDSKVIVREVREEVVRWCRYRRAVAVWPQETDYVD